MQRERRMQPLSRSWLLTVASAVAALAILGVYIATIVSESNDSIAEVTPWILVMSLAALLPVLALFSRTRAIVAGCLLGSAVIWTVMAAISSLVFVAVPAIFLLAFAYASYRESTKDAGANRDAGPVVAP